MDASEFFRKSTALRFVHAFGVLFFFLGILSLVVGVFFIFNFPLSASLSLFASGVSLLFLASMVSGFEFVVRAAIRYLESQNENV